MAKHGKEKLLTARPRANQLQRRFRDYALPSKVEDIRAEHVSEEELVELVKYAKSELLWRYKKYNQETTKKRLLEIRKYFDLDKQEEQYLKALGYALAHLEIVIQVFTESNPHPDKIKKVIEEAGNFHKHLKKFIQK